MGFPKSKMMALIMSAYGGAAVGQAAAIVAGVAVGSAGAVGSAYEGYTLTFGDDFDAFSRYNPLTLSGGYAANQLWKGSHRVSGGMASPNTNQNIYVDQYYRGDRSESPTALGYEYCSAANSVMTIQAAATPAALKPYLPANACSYAGLTDGKPRLVSGALRTWPRFMLSAQGDWVFETKFRMPLSIPNGYWPSIWFASSVWPEYQEFDLVEGIRTSGTSINSQTNLNGNTTDGGTNAGVTLAAPSVPGNTWVVVRAKKSGTTITVDTDVGATGTFTNAATYTNARVSRFKGPHDIYMELNVDNTWDSSTFSLAEWPKSFEIDWVRVWTPSAGGMPRAVQNLGYINTVPGGSWAATIPAITSLYTATPTQEDITGVFDNWDTPGQMHNASKLPRGMAVDKFARSVSGVVPPTEGGRVGLALMGSYASGAPVQTGILWFNVAPAAQGSLFAGRIVAQSSAVVIDVAYTDFHSGNLGPHTYTVTKSGGSWLTITGNGTTAVSITGTAPAVNESVTLTIACTNAIGQTTTVARTLTVAASAVWEPSQWRGLKHWYESELSSAFADVEGVTVATVGSAVRYLLDKRGVAHMRNTVGATASPTLITESTSGKPMLQFVQANSQNLVSDQWRLGEVASGVNKGFTITAAIRRNGAGTSSGVYFSFTRDDGLATTFDVIRASRGTTGAIVLQRQNSAGTALTAAQAAPSITADQVYVVSWVFTGTNALLRVNGVQTDSVACALPESLLFTGGSIGSMFDGTNTVFYSNDSIGSIFVSADASASADLVAAERYLGAKYGVTVA
jgi:hypothetical protein